MSEPADDTISIIAVGDVMMRTRPRQADIDAVSGLLAQPGTVLANIDVVISELGTPTPKWANLRGSRDLAVDFKAIGFDVVSMANNHSMDFRAEGMLDSRRAFDEAGLRHAGAGENLAAACAPVIMIAGGRTVAILSVSCTLPPESAAGIDSPGIAPIHVRQAFAIDPLLLTEQPGTVPEVRTWIDEADLARARQDVARAKEQANIVIVALHCGVPAPWRAPSAPTLQMYEQPLAHALIDAGADAVIGNHAHELHGIEFYRDRPIAYCLGNFWIDALDEFPWMERESVLFQLTFPPASAIPDVSLIPIRLDDAGVPRPDPTGAAIDILTARGDPGTLTVAPNGSSYSARAT